MNTWNAQWKWLSMSEVDRRSPRLALVTGGASEFGLGVAKAIIDQGGRVAIGDIHSEKLRQAVHDLSSTNVIPI